MKRRLTREEAALWAKVAQTVQPMKGNAAPLLCGEAHRPQSGGAAGAATREAERKPSPGIAPPSPLRSGPSSRAAEDRGRLDRHGLDASWDRKLSQGRVSPDFTLDLHGHGLDAAHARLDHGLALALAQHARVVLLITGRERPSEDRRGRGAIRRKFLDWLAAGPHASRIAAIRPAHPRHGGAGAVYIVLKRSR